MSKGFFHRALISVFDKRNLIPLAKSLSNSGCEIIASGVTSRTLQDAGIEVTPVESVTGAPEILGGRVKTLHPSIHGAILADSDQLAHQADLDVHGIQPIDLVIVNLYPFEETVSEEVGESEAIEEIDIGGVALIRAAAKNFRKVTVITDPAQYELLFSRIDSGFTISERRALAGQAFSRTRDYDSAIASWFDDKKLSLKAELVDHLRYGENPHQEAALYRFPESSGIAFAEILNGKAMSFNNYLDADAAFRSAFDHEGFAISIIKHTNPCGIAVAPDLITAYRKALQCDPISAFGGVVAANSLITGEVAAEIMKTFTEVVIAPDFDSAALEIFGKNSNLRVLRMKAPSATSAEIRGVSGGFLYQSRDRYIQSGDNPRNWKLMSGEPVSDAILQDLSFAWRSIRAVRSNAILIAKDRASVGIGMGQVNRLESARLAVASAGDLAYGAVAASDAFFPFSDGLEVLIAAGITAVVQPGGSKRDEEVIKAASLAGISMYFTGVRHFSH